MLTLPYIRRQITVNKTSASLNKTFPSSFPPIAIGLMTVVKQIYGISYQPLHLAIKGEYSNFFHS